MEYSPKKIKNDLDGENFKFKKKFGQNFIVDKNIIHSIINKADIDKDTLVIEIGPGAGALTSELGKVAGSVLAYEIDTSLKNILNKNIEDNTTVIYDDFLKRNVADDLVNYNFKKIYVVANLPYYITTPIIIKLIEDKLNIDKIVVMVQKEVGDRFKAAPNSKDYNSLSVFLNYYFAVEKLLNVSKNVFMPKPNVDSIVVAFTKREKRPFLKDENIFFKLIRDAFRQKRKTLKNNLSNYNLKKVDEVLNKYGFSLSVRAESLPIEVFVDISNNLADN